MTPQAPLADGQPFSAPFELTNTGYLGIHIDNIVAVFPKVTFQQAKFSDATATDLEWDNFDLGSGEGKTILVKFSRERPTSAQIVLVVFYKFWGISQRWSFRFDGLYMNNEHWQWSRQPASAMEEEINKSADRGLANHLKSNAESQ